jgi:ABC-type Fe3+/spermidine/putrescine transport system ATPase subunit
VALARALAVSPKGLLLDEPLSNLDARLRERMRGEIRRLVRRAGATAVYVTHDQEEALSIADRIAVMDAGRIVADRPSRDLLGDGELLARFGMEVPHSLIPHPHGRVGPSPPTPRPRGAPTGRGTG